MQLVSVVVPYTDPSPQAAAVAVGGVAADGAVGQRGRAAVVVRQAAAAVAGGGVAADGAVGQRGRAVFDLQAAAAAAPELPLTVQLVSVAVPPVVQAAAVSDGGVAADGAVGQRGRAVAAVQAAAVTWRSCR